MLFENLPPLGLGVIAFDLPAHGESGVDGDYLRLANCLADLAAVEARARELAPEAEIVYFASSFGAYITLIYLAGKKQVNSRAFLRSAAVSMPRIFISRFSQEELDDLEKTGALVLDSAKFSYSRDIKLTRGFFDDLRQNDVFDIWREEYASLSMVHGEDDLSVPLGDARAFAEKFHTPLAVIPGGDHQLSIPGAPERVLELALEFFRERG